MEYYEVLREPEAVQESSYMERGSVWDALTGKLTWGVIEECAGVFDHTGEVCIFVVEPESTDHHEIRTQVEQLLTAIRQAKADEAAGIIPPVKHGPKSWEELQESMQQSMCDLLQTLPDSPEPDK